MNIRFVIIFCGLLCLFFLSAEGTKTAKKKKTKKVCFVGVPQRASKYCKKLRAQGLAKKRLFYKISGPKNALPFPHLDQPAKTVIGYFIKEKFHSKWSYLYHTKLGNARTGAINAMKLKYGTSIFTTFDNYTKLEDDFRKNLLNSTGDSHFKYASRSYKYFVNLEKDQRFKEDYYFAQLRLSGLNPMAIKKVTLEGKSGTNYHDLSTRLNPFFDWEDAVISITEDDNIEESIEENKVYVVEYPELSGIKQMSDILAKYSPGRQMRNNPNQIAIFAIDPERELRAVAIQNRATKDGDVYTPHDGLNWTISKAELHISDLFFSAVVDHLLKTHFKMEPICLSMHRHLSKLHPLYQILQYHCRGLLPLNAFATPALLKVNITLRSLFSHGNEGATQLLLKEFPKMVWDDVDLEVNLKKRGMNDRRHMPYYPYRDDGRLVNRVLQRFANRLVRQYYRHDRQVRRDFELQNMIGELAQRKNTPNADKISKVKGLPSRFQSRWQLSKFVRQVLWIVVQHSMHSYSSADYGRATFFSTKLYDSKIQGKKLDFIEMLPGPIGAILLEFLVAGVGTYRYDTMFDYWKYIKCRKLKFLVKRAYTEMSMAGRRIGRRNRRRYERGQLTNPFMMRNWMTNSIST